MTKMLFEEFLDYQEEDGIGRLAGFETTGDMGIPVNIYIDNYEDVKDFQEGPCFIDVCGVSGEFDIYESKDAYLATEHWMDIISMIPAGTFPLDPGDEDFQPSPHILFTGIVKASEKDPNAKANSPNWCIVIETLELELILYVQYDGNVTAGNVVHGMTWLFGDIVPCENGWNVSNKDTSDEINSFSK